MKDLKSSGCSNLLAKTAEGLNFPLDGGGFPHKDLDPKVTLFGTLFGPPFWPNYASTTHFCPPQNWSVLGPQSRSPRVNTIAPSCGAATATPPTAEPSSRVWSEAKIMKVEGVDGGRRGGRKKMGMVEGGGRVCEIGGGHGGGTRSMTQLGEVGTRYVTQSVGLSLQPGRVARKEAIRRCTRQENQLQCCFPLSPPQQYRSVQAAAVQRWIGKEKQSSAQVHTVSWRMYLHCLAVYTSPSNYPVFWPLLSLLHIPIIRPICFCQCSQMALFRHPWLEQNTLAFPTVHLMGG